MVNFKIETTPVGHKAIPMSQIDVVSIFGGYGICDHCGKAKVHGYLVPVLGSKWNCDECHADFIKTAKFYPEDVPFEDRMLVSFVARIERYERDNNLCEYCGETPGFDEGCPMCNDPHLMQE